MGNIVTVGISDLNIAKNPDTLVTYALGSCVGICLYDAATRIAGLAHIMLPSSVQAGNTTQPYRFADSGIAALVRKMEIVGVPKIRLKAKIAGGAQMFAVTTNSSISNIGARNVAAVKETLAKFNIPIIANDTGSNYGRTVYFSAADGIMKVKSAIKGEWSF